MHALRCLFLLVGLSIFPGCAKKENSATAPAQPATTPHAHKAPHDGTAVVLGHEAYHLELVRDAASGRLTAYVLDGEMEAFVRVKAATLEFAVTANGGRRALTLRAVANPATGESVGDTSQFEAQEDWLKTTPVFDAVLASIEIKGSKFEQVAFNFPKGND